ncbi:MAG: hypothetical protein LBU64_06720 [Planctomycetota bacterium]|nr:hypothetical protein [Planctomycetota bacterium]
MDADKPVRKRRGLKIALSVIVVLFLLFAAAVWFLPYLLPIDLVRNLAKTRAREMLGVDLEFKSLGFGWNGSLVMEGIAVSPGGKEGEKPSPPLLSVAEVRTNVSLTALISGKIIVNQLTVNGFEARLRRGEDGSLNLPDLSRLAALAPERGAGAVPDRRIGLSALAGEANGASPPVIEVRQLELNRGRLAFEDAASAASLELGVDFVRVEGGSINDPFQFSGRLLPYPDDPARGEFPLSGRLALIRNNEFDPAGEAVLDVRINSFAPAELTRKLGGGGLIASGVVDGLVKLAYAEGKIKLGLSDFSLAGLVLDLGLAAPLRLPDSRAGLAAEFDPGPGSLVFTGLSFANGLANLEARGQAKGIPALAEGIFPDAAADFSGQLNFADLNGWLSGLPWELPELPELRGEGHFAGRLTLPGGETVASPALELEFSGGELGLREPKSGLEAEIGLAGTGLKAAAGLGDVFTLNSSLGLADSRLSLKIPPLGPEPVRIRLRGGVAATASGSAAAAEIRFADSEIQIPATPWAGAFSLQNPETRLTYDLARDELTVAALRLDLGDGVAGGIKSAFAAGLAAGEVRGRAELDFSARLAKLRELFRPLVPPEIGALAGAASGECAIEAAEGRIGLTLKAGMEKIDLALKLAPGEIGAEAGPGSLALAADFALADPLAINLSSLAADNSGLVVRFREREGNQAVSCQLGETALRLSGKVDAGNLRAELARLDLAGRGLSAALGRDGKQTAGLALGMFKASAGAGGAIFPLAAEGDFKFPSLAAEIDRLVFSRLDADRRDDSDFGKIAAGLNLEGRIGGGGRQLLTLRTASLAARPLAVNARGMLDLAGGELALEYAAAIAPAELASLFSFLNLPPALLSRATASGVLTWNGSTATSKGNLQGQLRLSGGEANPFEMNHEIAASYQAGSGTLNLEMRRLDGKIKSASGEATATLAAQPANLTLGRDGARGALDIRLGGLAAPTRVLILGLAGIFPQLGEYSNLIYNSQAGGAYNAWLQLRGNDSATLSLAVGGVWQGAALALGQTPQVSEAGKLTAGLEGEYHFRENRLRVSRLLFQSDSGQLRAGGTADLTLAADENGFPAGLAEASLDLGFAMPDAARTAMVFPGVLTPDLGLRGRVEGLLKISGGASDLRVEKGSVRFQDFQARLGGSDFSIPAGSADLEAILALRLDRVSPVPESPYAALGLVDARDGRGSLSGAVLDGIPIRTLAGEFQLENGLLTLKSGRAVLGDEAGGEAKAAGRIDFNSPAPAVDLRLSIGNLPLSLANSQLEDYLYFEKGALNLPADPSQSAGVSFSGFSEDEILRTLRLDNFIYATGPVVLHTGNILNAELDKAKGLMHQEVREESQSRVITLLSLSGSAAAAGDGNIIFPPDRPIQVTGDNTGDFRVQGRVAADHTMDLTFHVTGKLENLIGFSLPNLIPNLRSGSDEDRRGFMTKMNQNAAAGHYSVHVTGNLEAPNLSGISLLVTRFLADIVAAAPAQIIGGALDLVKDAPGALINAPKNLGRGLGRVFGLPEEGGTESPAAPPSGSPPAETPPAASPLPGLRLPFRFH